MERGGCIYIMTNDYRKTLYIGVTSNLQARILEHISHLYPKSFTAKYNLHSCVYYETFFSIEEAIAREKELKAWRRSKKNELISSANPTWTDLWLGEISKW
nr:GIY-YIG nuclease family protein [uncultured Pedobacter sp.]